MQARKLGASIFAVTDSHTLGPRQMYTLYYAVIKIKLVKPEKVQMIENSLIAAAQQGKLRSRVSEQELVSMLETTTKTEAKITVRV